MRRYHQEEKIIKRNHREHLRVHAMSGRPITCPCDKQAGRFRKTDGHDCGQTMCRICHYEKWLRDGGHEETRQEKLSKIKMKEQVES